MVEQGFQTSAPTHIVFIDAGHVADIQLASANTIVVHNRLPPGSANLAGNVTLI